MVDIEGILEEVVVKVMGHALRKNSFCLISMDRDCRGKKINLVPAGTFEITHFGNSEYHKYLQYPPIGILHHGYVQNEGIKLKANPALWHQTPKMIQPCSLKTYTTMPKVPYTVVKSSLRSKAPVFN
jgi:hypothetical protein